MNMLKWARAKIVGIAGHLDIVPVGGDWTYDPFKPDPEKVTMSMDVELRMAKGAGSGSTLCNETAS